MTACISLEGTVEGSGPDRWPAVERKWDRAGDDRMRAFLGSVPMSMSSSTCPATWTQRDRRPYEPILSFLSSWVLRDLVESATYLQAIRQGVIDRDEWSGWGHGGGARWIV